jgi:hypothetical protein
VRQVVAVVEQTEMDLVVGVPYKDFVGLVENKMVVEGE